MAVTLSRYACNLGRLDFLSAAPPPRSGSEYLTIQFPHWIPDFIPVYILYAGKTLKELSIQKFMEISSIIMYQWAMALLNWASNLDEFERALFRFKDWREFVYDILASKKYAATYKTEYDTRTTTVSFDMLSRIYPKLIPVFFEQYDKFANALMAKRDQLKADAQSYAMKEGNLSSVTDVSFRYKKMMMEYYNGLIYNLNFIISTTNVAQAFRSWDAVKETLSDETKKYADARLYLNPADRAMIDPMRVDFYKKYNQAAAIIRNKELVKQELVQKQSPTPENITYADVGITSKMRTGLWSQVEQERLEVTNAQIRKADYDMNAFTAKIEEALKVNDINRKKQIRGEIVPKAQLYANGVSAGVKDSAMWQLAVQKYNDALIQLNEQIGDGGMNWGMLLAIGGLAIGGYMYFA